MIIKNSVAEDIDEIFTLYKIATVYQKERDSVCWPNFDRPLIETEIQENHQWKMMAGDAIACVWATTFSDPFIWKEKNEDAAVYIHRIATNPAFRGNQLVTRIMDWAKGYAAAHNKNFLRLDTVGENKGLIKHYTSCGFNFLGLSKLTDTESLPAHYNNASVSLFELPLR